MHETLQKANPNEDRRAHLKAAEELAEEIMPRLEAEFPLAHQKLQEMIANEFEEDDIQLDAGEMLSKIQNVMEQRDQVDPVKLAQTMESIAQGKDPGTGEIISYGTTQ